MGNLSFIGVMIATLMQTPTPLEPIKTTENGSESTIEGVAENLAQLEPTYSTDVDSDCKVYNPFPQENEVYKWEGQCKDGYAHGQGLVTIHIDGKLIEQDTGIHVHGKIVGSGIMKFFDDEEKLSETYTGEFIDSIANGKGLRIRSDGSTYYGNFKDGVKFGFGKLTLSAKNKTTIDSYELDNIGSYNNEGNYVIEGVFMQDGIYEECKKDECETIIE